ncbi:MAG TPA: FtsX-like permease family protein [Cyclobacteriaceae bacterium]|nr:FtsX-like permease family protein [Cyclobacteriaceae bacterium]HRK54843.1 FtsX-like permease family protein [Cyclobacteriaceae bacterium]
MNLSLFIAKRYFFSKRKQNFINIISILSMVGVAFSTAALIIVLSVFNGLEGLLRSLYVSFDPELKIEAAEGKSFEVNDELLSKLNAIEGVNVVTEVIEDYAYIRYRDADVIATIKGVSDNFIDQHRLDDRIVQGEMKLKENGIDYAILGRGIQYALSVAVDDEMYALQVFYIKDLKQTSLDPSQMYSRKSIRPGGVFSIEKNYDENYIFLPLDFVVDLLDYGNRRTALEIKTDEGVNLNSLKQKVSETIGKSFVVLTNEEQQKDLYRLLKIEKLFTFLALSLLITVGSINIFFSLMMLAIDKKKDISILSAIGADQKLIRRIFFSEGAIISFIGAGSGLLIGGLICWAQDQFGLVGMGMENAVVSDYPVKMIWSDFAITSLVIVGITFLVSFYPAILASRSYSTQNL